MIQQTMLVVKNEILNCLNSLGSFILHVKYCFRLLAKNNFILIKIKFN